MYVPPITEHQILRLYIPMNDSRPMDILKAHTNTRRKELRLFLSKRPLPSNMISQIASS
jgi:hypothetical protein